MMAEWDKTEELVKIAHQAEIFILQKEIKEARREAFLEAAEMVEEQRAHYQHKFMELGRRMFQKDVAKLLREKAEIDLLEEDQNRDVRRKALLEAAEGNTKNLEAGDIFYKDGKHFFKDVHGKIKEFTT